MNIKTTHVGSLPRPQEMITRTLKKQEITTNDLRNYLHEILEKQISKLYQHFLDVLGGIKKINGVIEPFLF